MSALFNELHRLTKLSAYVQTGDERHLKDMPPLTQGPLMGANDPVHLPQPVKEADPLVFDIYDDDLMKDCIGGNLTKPVQALLVTLHQWEMIPAESVASLVKLELMKLREAVKEEFKAL